MNDDKQTEQKELAARSKTENAKLVFSSSLTTVRLIAVVNPLMSESSGPTVSK